MKYPGWTPPRWVRLNGVLYLGGWLVFGLVALALLVAPLVYCVAMRSRPRVPVPAAVPAASPKPRPV